MTRAGQVVARRFQPQPLLRIERREVLEEELVARLVGRLEVDRLDLDQREIPLAVFRRPHLAGDRVAGLQVELADLRRRHVDVVGARQVVVVGRAQEAESVRQHFEHAFGEHEAAQLGLRLEDLENQILLAHAGRAGDVQILGDLGELLNAHVLQVVDVERLERACPFGGASPFGLGLAAWAAPGLTGAGSAAGWRCGFGRRRGQRPAGRQADALRSVCVDWP